MSQPLSLGCRSRLPFELFLAACIAFSSLFANAAVADSPTLRTVVVKDEEWRQASSKPVSASEIDSLVAKELKRNGVESSGLTTDEEFFRRVNLDVTGQLPKPADLSAFVADADPDKRAKVIDRLLASDAYARHWARYWRDVVTARVTTRRTMGLTRSFEEWLFEEFRAGKNWKEIVTAIVTAEGKLRFTLNTPSAENGSLFFLVAHSSDEAEERASETARVFMGFQIQCAQCHDHPSEPWTRREFHQLAAYFARIKYEQLFEEKKLTGVQLVTLSDREHRMNNQGDSTEGPVVHPRFLNGQEAEKALSDRDRRRVLADVLVSEKNHWFAAAFVNRIWGELMGESFYQHVDDMGPAKPVVFPEVLTRLTRSFQGTNYDPKELFRAILNSQAYQRQIRLAKTGDIGMSFSGTLTRLRADALWESLVAVLGSLEYGARFHTGGGVRFNGSFLEGKFKSTFDFDPSVSPKEVKGSIPQALLLMNNAKLNERIKATPTNFLGRTLKEAPDDADAVAKLYRHVLARNPTDRERDRCVAYVKTIPTRAEAYEDILWALINSTEFQTKR